MYLHPNMLPVLLQDGNPFRDAVYNETITITEPDEGLDGET